MEQSSRSSRESSFCGSPCGSFCGSRQPRSAPRSAPRTPDAGTPGIPLRKGDCDDRVMLTSYSPCPFQQPEHSADYLLPQPICIRGLSIRSRGGRSAGPSVRPIRRHASLRSGGSRFLAPASPRLSAAARLADFGGLGISPTQWVAMGLETTTEAI